MKYTIIIFALAFTGCICNQPELEPLPPYELHDLLHISENYAYKSVTIKDYIGEKEWN